MLGGAVRDKVAVYATGLYYQDDEFPTKLIAEAEAYVEAGYAGMKTKVGGLSVADDVKRVQAIRDAIGDDVYLMIDANKAYSARTAIDVGRRLEDLNIHWFEEPVMEFDQTPNPIRNELASIAFGQSGGFVDVPRGVGLGIEIDLAALERFCLRHFSSK